MNMRKGLILGTALACAVSSFAWYTSVSGTVNPETSVKLAPKAAARPIPTVLVREPHERKVRMFPGTVRSRHQVDLSFSIAGVLVELNGKEGSSVSKGDVIARLDDRDARNAFEAAKANYTKVNADFSRFHSLHKKNVIAQAEYDGAKAAADMARADYKIREKALEDTVITAPYDGVIAVRYVENYAHVKDQKPIVALTDTSNLEIAIQVPERLMASGGIENFSGIQARFDIGGNRWFDGRVKEYNVQSDAVTRTYAVIVQVEPPEDLDVLPGMTATVQLALEEVAAGPDSGSAVAFIPVESVRTASDGSTFVWQIPEKGGRPKKIEVELGGMRNDGIEVLGGLEPGLRIARAGIHSLSEEMLVRPMREGGEGLDG